MRPKSRIPRSKKCNSCHKQVLLAGYDCHIQKCTGLLNQNNNKLGGGGVAGSCDGTRNEMKPASMKDYESTMSTKNINLLTKVSRNTGDLIACKYCAEHIPQKKYIKHITLCAKAMRSSATQHSSPTRQAYFKTGRLATHNTSNANSVMTRQTPFELSKGHGRTGTEDLLKTNAFIQETLLQSQQVSLPETHEDCHGHLSGTSVSGSDHLPNSRPTSALPHHADIRSRPNSGQSRQSGTNASLRSPAGHSMNATISHEGVEGSQDNAAQIAELEKKIQEIEEKLSPTLALQHTIKMKVLPFSRPKKSKSGGNNNKNNLKVPPSPIKTSGFSSGNHSSQQFSSYPPSPISQANQPPQKLHQCEHCNRTFHLKAFEKHSEICLRVFVGKRPFFDTERARLKGTPMEYFYWKTRRASSGKGSRRPRSAPKTRRSDGVGVGVGVPSYGYRAHNGSSNGQSQGLSQGQGVSSRHGWHTRAPASPQYISRLDPQQHQQLQQLRSSTAPTGVSRHKTTDHMIKSLSSSASNNRHHNTNSRCTTPKKKRLHYYNSKKNYGLFSLRLNLFETPAAPAVSAAHTGSGGCRLVKADNWRSRSRQFREAITAARVIYYSRQCANPYKC